ncbi:MarR family transcriptional regulator [Paenibacillus filicis]|uniref:MarR family transcriptional regulator n=1 Tax=Paenibacillus filicis TaxID=669464 RepID=A0ABU9DJT1_9BACL
MSEEHDDMALELMRAFRQLRQVNWGNRRPLEGCTPSETMLLFVVRRSMNGCRPGRGGGFGGPGFHREGRMQHSGQRGDPEPRETGKHDEPSGGPQGLKASELSELLRVSSPTVSQMVNVLEARGLLERQADPSDRRVVRIRLSDAGLQATAEGERRMLEGMTGLIGHLGAERSSQLTGLLNDVGAYYRELAGKAEAQRSDEMDHL